MVSGTATQMLNTGILRCPNPDPCTHPRRRGLPSSLPTIPGARHCPIILPKGLVQLHATPLALGKVCLPDVPYHTSLRPTNL